MDGQLWQDCDCGREPVCCNCLKCSICCDCDDDDDGSEQLNEQFEKSLIYRGLGQGWTTDQNLEDKE